jgi:hypothetical protein
MSFSILPVDELSQRPPAHQLHRDEIHAIRLRDVVDGDDAGMVERGRGPGLLCESSAPLGIGDEVWWQDFQCDMTVEVIVVRLVRDPRPPSPSGARIV